MSSESRGAERCGSLDGAAFARYKDRIRNFKRLDVWRRAHQLAIDLNHEADRLHGRYRFGLGDQMARAASSIGANIAEGAGRESLREFRRHLTIAIGSTAELENHLLLVRDLELLREDSVDGYLSEAEEIRRMLFGLRSKALR